MFRYTKKAFYKIKMSFKHSWSYSKILHFFQRGFDQKFEISSETAFLWKRPRYVVWWCCIHKWTKAIHWCSILGHHNITLWDKYIKFPCRTRRNYTIWYGVALSTFSELRRIHTKGLAPRACSRGTLREQSSSVCTNDFIGILYPREQNLHPAKCSTIFNRLNIWEQAAAAKWANLKTLPRVYWNHLLRVD